MRSTRPDESRGRNTGIDLFRGLLVLAVILGHFSELTQRQSLFTWLGYGFRMPLFIGLTGYLFNLERSRALPLWQLLRKYHRRLILPWLVACAVHLTITSQLDYLSPLSIFMRPPFHLWFVPVMMAFILIATISKRDPSIMLAIAIPASIAAMYIFGVGHSIERMPGWMPDRRFFVYPIYFFWGLWVARTPPSPWLQRASLLLAPTGLLWWCRLYDHPAPAAEVAAELTLCISLISMLPWVRHIAFRVPPVESIGRESLFFYLWHPLAFGLWASCGVFGLPMLALSIFSLAVARAALAPMPTIAGLMGILPRNIPTRSPGTVAPEGAASERGF